MEIKQATFVVSNTQVAKCPTHKLPEYAFIGRSNVGKSSLINMLTNHKGLAKTSSKPGKTQLINHFLINKEWYLVDLPGYGYAKVSKQSKKTFQQFITDYFKKRRELVCAFVLVDIRHEPQKIDLEFMQWLGENAIPFAIVFTNGGLGAYPLFIAKVLLLFGVAETAGTALGWVIWIAQFLMIVLFGGLSFLLLPLINRGQRSVVRL